MPSPGWAVVATRRSRPRGAVTRRPPGLGTLPSWAEVPGWGAGGGGPEPYTRDISDLVRRAMQNGVRDQGAADWAVPPMGGGGQLDRRPTCHRR